jgi:hypothetical protein
VTTTDLETQLRTAVDLLSDGRNLNGHRVDCDSRELLEMIRLLLRVREPLARWLDQHRRYVATRGAYDVLALDIARAINGTGEPERGQDGHIEDRHTGQALYAQLLRAAGEGE